MDSAVEARHPASPWRSTLVSAILSRVDDSDVALAGWLLEGAPPSRGGLCLLPDAMAVLMLEELGAQERWAHNHLSFEAAFDGGPPPGVQPMVECVNSDFGEVFEDSQAAAIRFGVEPRPLPLGTIFKGTGRHSSSNCGGASSTRRCAFRNAVDLSHCAHTGQDTGVVRTLALDFQGRLHVHQLVRGRTAAELHVHSGRSGPHTSGLPARRAEPWNGCRVAGVGFRWAAQPTRLLSGRVLRGANRPSVVDRHS